MAGLLDFLQAASNGAASNVSAPVDGLAWLLRKAGVDVGESVLGSAWLERQGLTRPVQQSGASLAGETAGLLAPLMAAAKAPQVARALLQMGENAAAPRVFGMAASQRGGVPIGHMTDAQREAAMRAAGYDRGWYRGGPKITDGKKSGDWYTYQAPEEAADYARRFGANGEVREYAVPIKETMQFDRGYPSRMAHDIAARVEGLGEKGAKLASELRSYDPGEYISGAEAWRSLSKWLGDDVAANTLSDIGWRAVQGINSPTYLRVLPRGTVRDAEKAMFDPARIRIDDIFGAADPALLSALGVGAGGLMAAMRTRGGG